MNKKNDVITVEDLPSIKKALLALELEDSSLVVNRYGAEVAFDIAKIHAMLPTIADAVYDGISEGFEDQSGLSFEDVNILVCSVTYELADANGLSDKINKYLDEGIIAHIVDVIFLNKKPEHHKSNSGSYLEPDDYTARVLNSYEIVPYLAGEMLDVFLKKLPEGSFTEKFKAEVGEYLNKGNTSIGAAKISEITQRIIPTKRLDSEDATQPSFMAIAMLTKIYKSMAAEKVSDRVESLIERFLHNDTLQQNFLTTRFVNIPDKNAGSPKMFDLKVAFKRACGFLSETMDEIAGGTLTYQGLMRYCEAEAVSDNFKELLKPKDQRKLAELLKSFASVVYMQALDPEMTHDIHKVVDRIDGELVKNSGPRR